MKLTLEQHGLHVCDGQLKGGFFFSLTARGTTGSSLFNWWMQNMDRSEDQL